MANGTQILWVNDLSGGINQATAPHLLGENQFKLSVNTIQREIGGIGHRLGTERYLDLIAGSGPVRGLHMYQKSNGNRYLHMVAGGNLYVADEVNNNWDTQDSSEWNAASEIDMANFINRHYMASSNDTEYLRYATESGNVSAVVSGNIVGRYLATNGPYLMVVDPTNRKAQWSGTATDTFDGADFANINGYATGVGSFGAGRPFVVFTDRNYLIVDPANETSDEVNVGIGCTSHRSIQNVKGYLIFLGKDGFYMLGLNDSFPQEISRVIRNDWSMDAIFNKIDGSNWSVTASGVIDDRYFCALRDLSGNVKGYDLNDVVVEFDVSAQTIKVHTFETGGIGSVFAQFIDENGDLDLYAGSYDSRAVFKMFIPGKFTDANSADEDSDITARIITKDHAFYDKNSGVVTMMNVTNLHFRYKATSALTVKYSLDGDSTYDTLPVTLPATTSGYGWEWKDAAFGFECKQISLDISGTGEWMLYGIGYEVESLGNTGLQLI
jgi:hypothetical protein